MGVNKVMFGAESLIDISDSTVTPETLVEGATAYGANGDLINGKAIDTGKGKYLWEKHSSKVWEITKTTIGTTKPSDCVGTAYSNHSITEDGYFELSGTSYLGGYYYISGQSTNAKSIYRANWAPSTSGGNGTTTYYLWTISDTYTEGKGNLLGYVSSNSENTYPSNGIQDGYYYVKINTSSDGGIDTSPTLQSKSVTPSETAQTVTPDSGYDGLSQVSVGAISSTYIGSGVTKKSAQTYTPRTSDQTIAKDQYLSGDQTIKGDSNLVASNIKKGVSLFGVTGSYEASSGGSSNNNCEAYHITNASTALSFKRTDGTIKVWGYGYKQSGSYQKTVYAFCGDGYYTGSSYMNPTKTSVTWGLNSDGTLSGLPSGLTALDVLVTKGV